MTKQKIFFTELTLSELDPSEGETLWMRRGSEKGGGKYQAPRRHGSRGRGTGRCGTT